MNPYLQNLRTKQQFGAEVDDWADEDEFGGMLPDVKEMGFNAKAKWNTLWASHKGKVFWTVGALTTAAIGYGGWQFYQKKKADELGAPIQGAANKKTSSQDDPFEEEEQLNLFEIIEEEEPAGSQNKDSDYGTAMERALAEKKGSSAETAPWWELNGDPEGITSHDPQKKPTKQGSPNPDESDFLPGVEPLF